ncbi:ABC transporter ATP-binding protein [Marinicrinis sediminis]|uniref:ABC transporter ATP-binding protein n=1 Tax=Marinicrinis sediminis TaxID=1652465 RepID=A0ABW5RDX7_9BACL
MADLMLDGLKKQYQQGKRESGFSIGPVHFHITKGESFAILGPSGCGKTTLLKCIAGLLQTDEGVIRLGDETITDLPAEKRGFGMVFQQPLLFPHMPVIDNIAFGLKMQGWSKKNRKQAAQEVLGAVGLAGFDDRYPNELSGGQQQRVALARAIVTKPKLLLLDEPFSALDPGIRAEMRQLVRDIHQQYQITMLLVTHDREEAFELADRIAVMQEGKVLQIGSPMDVYMKPYSPEVARFIGARNVFNGELKQGVFESESFRLDLSLIPEQPPGSVTLVIRPEQMRISRDPGEAVLHGEVQSTRLRQGFYELAVHCQGKTLHILQRMDADSRYEAGDQVGISLDVSELHLIASSIQGSIQG